MGRSPCCSREELYKGSWTKREDALLTSYIQINGEGNWNSLPKKAGLRRCGKSCRLRWMNYLRPDIKRGNITSEEEDLIIRLHILLGNRWSLIAGRLPGRTDNEVKNYWNCHLCKKLRMQGFVFSQTASKRSKRSQAHNGCCRKMGSEETQPQARDMKIYAPKPTRIVPKYVGCNVNCGGEEEELWKLF